MKQQRIAVDIDDVLVPHGDILIDHLNEVFGKEADINGFFSLDELMVQYDKEREEVRERIHVFLESEEFARLEPIEESIEGIEQLKRSYELLIVTARPGITHRMTKAWLKEHFPDTFTDVYFSNLDYHWGTLKKVSKQNACQAIGAEYLIDDSIKHIEEVVECGMKGILFGDYHWNQADVLPEGSVRARDWKEVVEILL